VTLLRLPVALLLAVAGCSQPTPTGTEPPTTTLPPPPTIVRIMPLGDSITQANRDRNSYRRPLWQGLVAEGFAVDFVGSLRDNHLGPPPNPDFDLDHEGHWGWTADEVLAEIPGWAAAHRPDVVLLQLGTNDVLRGQSLPETLDELAGIVDALRVANPAVSVLLARLTPFDGPENDRIARFNDLVPGLVARLDAPASRVLEVDQFTAIDPVADTVDGLHPNTAGEARIAERWLQALRPVLAARRRSDP
jgi:lysophospholipase L1-like esterase